MPAEFKGLGCVASDKWSDLETVSYQVKPFGPHDIDIKIEACGICSSDLHTLKAEWGGRKYNYPLVVGHEIVGRVISVGPQVSSLKVGDRVGVGAQSASCLQCVDCTNDNEQYCTKSVGTYNSVYPDGSISRGGYASHARVHEHFVFPIPDALPSHVAGPLMCAGITVYSPLKRNGAAKGKKIGVVGLGGLGAHCVLFAKHIFGAEVTVFSRTNAKKEDAMKLGADHYIATSEEGAFDKHFRELDLIVGTANSTKGFDLNKYLSTLKINGRYVSVGLPADGSFDVSTKTFLRNACYMGSSLLGSRKEILEMLEACAQSTTIDFDHWVEKVPINKENAKVALERMHANDVRFRFCFVDYDKEFN